MATDAHAPTRLDFEETASNTHAEVLDVEDVGRLLRVGRNTVYELVGRNAIPHRRVGKNIRFSRAAILTWLAIGIAKDGK